MTTNRCPEWLAEMIREHTSFCFNFGEFMDPEAECDEKLAWAEYLASDKSDGLAWTTFMLTYERARAQYSDEKAASDTDPDNDNRHSWSCTDGQVTDARLC